MVTNVTKAREFFFFPKQILLLFRSRPLFLRAREDRERERERQESSATSGAFFETRDDDSVLNCDFLSPFRPPPPPRCTKNLWIRLDIFVFSTDTKASFIPSKLQWMLDAPDCEKARTGNLDRVQSAPRHCPIAAIDVNRLCQSSGGVLQVDNNAVQFEVSGKDGQDLRVQAVHGSFMLSNKGHTMKIGQKKKMKVKPGQLIIFEDGEAYEVYRNTEAHA